MAVVSVSGDRLVSARKTLPTEIVFFYFGPPQHQSRCCLVACVFNDNPNGRGFPEGADLRIRRRGSPRKADVDASVAAPSNFDCQITSSEPHILSIRRLSRMGFLPDVARNTDKRANGSNSVSPNNKKGRPSLESAAHGCKRSSPRRNFLNSIPTGNP